MEPLETIKAIKEKTSHVWIFTKMGNGMLWVCEILCYLSVIAILLVAIFLPDGTATSSYELSETERVKFVLEMDEIKEVVLLLKIIIALLGVFMLVPGLLFRKLRQKNNQLEEIDDLVSKYLKSQSPG